MTYKEAISFLYNQLPYFQKIGGKALKNSLDNIQLFCEYLGNPQDNFKSVHIAGTNGKGSTSHFLASIFQESGYKTGLYTSPHLKDFRERFKINGNICKKSSITTFLSTHYRFIQQLQPSFFELSVAFAFDYFSKEKVDIAIIEVGLGGRLDATNIITPELSIITNIGLDHKEILGDTLAKIAFEKAGIIKKNVPVVISEYLPETFEVFSEIAQKKEATIYRSDGFELILKQVGFTLKSNYTGNYYELNPELKGLYQQQNTRGVILAAELLASNFTSITKVTICNGINNVVTNTKLKGRWQQLSKKPLIICDTGHNKEAFEVLISQLNSLNKTHYHYILGFSKDKDSVTVLNKLPGPKTFYFTTFDSFRSMKKQDFNELDLDGVYFENVNEALEIVKSKIKKDEMIFIGGSTYLIAELKKL